MAVDEGESFPCGSSLHVLVFQAAADEGEFVASVCAVVIRLRVCPIQFAGDDDSIHGMVNFWG